MPTAPREWGFKSLVWAGSLAIALAIAAIVVLSLIHI